MSTVPWQRGPTDAGGQFAQNFAAVDSQGQQWVSVWMCGLKGIWRLKNQFGLTQAVFQMTVADQQKTIMTGASTFVPRQESKFWSGGFTTGKQTTSSGSMQAQMQVNWPRWDSWTSQVLQPRTLLVQNDLLLESRTQGNETTDQPNSVSHGDRWVKGVQEGEIQMKTTRATMGETVLVCSRLRFDIWAIMLACSVQRFSRSEIHTDKSCICVLFYCTNQLCDCCEWVIQFSNLEELRMASLTG